MALLCDKGTRAVVAIDRMITSESLSLRFEQQQCKINKITQNCVVVSAGNALSPTDILRDAQLEIGKLTAPTIRKISEHIKQSFIQNRKTKVEDTLLKPRGIETLNNFYEQIRQLPPEIAVPLDDQISRFHIYEGDITQLMVIGTDITGSHIYLVYDPGRSQCFDAIGFNAIGSGEPHAVSTITSYDFNVNFGLNEAIWIAFEAKKRAEKAPGVGRAMDLCIIEPEKGIIQIDEKFIKLLNENLEGKLSGEKEFLRKIPRFTDMELESVDDPSS